MLTHSAPLRGDCDSCAVVFPAEAKKARQCAMNRALCGFCAKTNLRKFCRMRMKCMVILCGARTNNLNRCEKIAHFGLKKEILRRPHAHEIPINSGFCGRDKTFKKKLKKNLALEKNSVMLMRLFQNMGLRNKTSFNLRKRERVL